MKVIIMQNIPPKPFPRRKSGLPLTAMALAMLALCAGAETSYALDTKTTPVGETVVSGSASFSRPQEGRLKVNQSTDRAIIHWESFDIGKNAVTEFRQPGRTSLAVNRVVGGGNDPTQILGRLKANGNVMVLDPNGVIFGRESRVDVGGIIASTGEISDADVLDADDQFTFTGLNDEAAITLRGDISVAQAGLAAFVAPVVRNSGTIRAKLGRVALAGGAESITIDFSGDELISFAPGGDAEIGLIENSGRIVAESGEVAMTAGVARRFLDSAINISGIIDVSSVSREGGKIVLRGNDVNLSSSGRLNAESGRSRGGDIDVTVFQQTANIRGRVSTSARGDAGDISIVRGDGFELASTARINADSERGRGGDITLGAESSNAIIAGRISSSGRTGGGDINIENGDAPVLVKKSAYVLSEARQSGRAGNIDVSSAEARGRRHQHQKPQRHPDPGGRPRRDALDGGKRWRSRPFRR
jgi:filamentous hemagglutinin family protein